MNELIYKILPRRATVMRWLVLIIVVLIITVVFFIYRQYLQSFTVYDFSHLTPQVNSGELFEFTPMLGDAVLGKVMAAENDFLALYINPLDTTIAVYDKRNSHIWYSNPPNAAQDAIANPFEKNVMASHVGFTFFNDRGTVFSRWLYNDAILNDQFEIFSIQNGVAIKYLVGMLELGIYALPRHMEAERFQTRVLDQIEDRSDRTWMRGNFSASEELEGFLTMRESVRTGPANLERLLRIFDEIGYTEEELESDNAEAGYEPEITLDVVTIYVEFILDGSELIVNVPLERIEMTEGNSFRSLEIMRFFGAADMDDEGFILVPSGSGAIINFNNGKQMEEMFTASVYGIDFLTTHRIPQNLQTVRLPVFAINKGNAAILAQIENGAALANINADVSGRTNSFNSAWFSFTIRNSINVEIGLPGNFTMNNMNVMQSLAYEGDITIRYHFLYGDEISLGDLAQTYQNYLVSKEILTPLTENKDRTFYLDIIGVADVQKHFLGVAYNSLETMTSFEEANRIIDLLNEGGVYNVQMLLHGWFNRGLNHDVAGNVNILRGLGRPREINELHERLQTHDGALSPAINFVLTNFDSRRFNATFEAARDISGIMGVMTRVARDMLTTRFSMHRNDWFYLVNPAVIPFHIDKFIPEYRRNVNINSLALTDLGDLLTESQYRRNPVDRKHSSLIAAEQIERLGREFQNLVVFGGNDYSLRYANHLVDIPLYADWFYIIDYEVPFYQMVMHGFIEFSGSPVNIQPNPNPRRALLNSIATGASPRFTLTGQPTRLLQFSPHERLQSTLYENWLDTAIEYYLIFNEIFKDLRTERIVDFKNLGGTIGNNITVTTFSNGTKIYVNNTSEIFIKDDLTIMPFDFYVVVGG